MSRLSIRCRCSTGGELGRDRAADLLRRRVRRPQLRELLLELLQPAQPLVVVGVGQGRVVEHEVAPARVLDLLADPLVLVASLRSGLARALTRSSCLWPPTLAAGTHPSARLVRIDTVAAPDLTRLDAPSPRGGRAPAARRQGALRRAGRRAERVVAPDGGPAARGDPGRARGGRQHLAAALPGARLERRAAGRGRPLGAGGGTPRARPGPGRAARATRWAAGPPCTSPTTRRWSASSPWPRGSPAARRSPAWSGKPLRAAHGRRDRITSYRATAAYVARANAAGADATLRDMGWAGHYMLSRIGLWNAFARQETLQLLAGPDRQR